MKFYGALSRVPSVPKWIQIKFDRSVFTLYSNVLNPWISFWFWYYMHSSYPSAWYRQLRARRALSIFKDVPIAPLELVLNRTDNYDHVCSVPLRTRRALSLYIAYGDSALLVLNGTSLSSDSALLALNWRYDHVQHCGKWGKKLQYSIIWVKTASYKQSMIPIWDRTKRPLSKCQLY